MNWAKGLRKHYLNKQGLKGRNYEEVEKED